MKDGNKDFRKTIGKLFFTAGVFIIAFVLVFVGLVFVGFSKVPLEVYQIDETSSQLEEYYEDHNITGVLNIDDYMGGYYPMMNLMIWVSVSFVLLTGGYFLCKIGFMFMESKKENSGLENHPLLRRRTQNPEYREEEKKGWL